MLTTPAAVTVHLDTSKLRLYQDAPGNYCHFVLGNLFEVFVGLHEHGLLDADLALTLSNPSSQLSALYSIFTARPVRIAPVAAPEARTIVLSPSADWTTLEFARDLSFYLPAFREFVARRVVPETNARAKQLTLVQRNPLFGNRYAIDESLLIRELQQYCLDHALGFCVVDFAKLSFEDQVQTMADTAVLVGMHGAGLVNSLFLPKGAAVIELLPHRRFDARFFRLMGLAKGNHWVRVTEPSTNVLSLPNVFLTLTRPGHTRKNRFYRDRNAIFDPASVLRAVASVWPDDPRRTGPIDGDVDLLPSERRFGRRLSLVRTHKKLLLALGCTALASTLPFALKLEFWPLALTFVMLALCA